MRFTAGGRRRRVRPIERLSSVDFGGSDRRRPGSGRGSARLPASTRGGRDPLLRSGSASSGPGFARQVRTNRGRSRRSPTVDSNRIEARDVNTRAVDPRRSAVQWIPDRALPSSRSRRRQALPCSVIREFPASQTGSTRRPGVVIGGVSGTPVRDPGTRPGGPPANGTTDSDPGFVRPIGPDGGVPDRDSRIRRREPAVDYPCPGKSGISAISYRGIRFIICGGATFVGPNDRAPTADSSGETGSPDRGPGRSAAGRFHVPSRSLR